MTVEPRAAEIRGSDSEACMRKLIVLAAAATAVFVAGCNTVQGVGRDMQAAGRAVTGTAEDARR